MDNNKTNDRTVTPLESMFERFDSLVGSLDVQAHRSEVAADKFCGSTPAEARNDKVIEGEGIVSAIHKRLDVLSSLISRIATANERLTEL